MLRRENFRMKKHLTKLMALALAFSMTLAMSATAFAALGDDATGSETGVQEGNAGAVTINTAVVVTNNETTAASGKVVAYPAMSFKYVAAPATVAAGTTVTDATNEDPEHPSGPATTVEVKAGVADGITVSGGTLATGTVTLNANGQEVVLVPTTFTGDISKFSAAGIYRYAITDQSTTDATNLAALEDAGVVKGATTDQEYFLDVYVKNGTSGLEFGGFVLMNSNPTTIDKSTDPQTNTDLKESGFDETELTTTTEGGTTVVKLDPTTPADLTKNYSYTTYNVTLNKAIAGGLGDKKHGFPFAVAVGVQGTHPSLGYDYEITGNDNTANNVALTNQTAIPASINLSNNGTLKLWGLSPFATINYTETNDTDSKYQVKVGETAGAADIQAEVEKAKNETLAAWAAAQNITTGYAIGTTATLNTVTDAVYYTNTLNDISPTGVVLRFAPYIFIAAAAVLLLVFARRRREDY
jgi:hypothetical protein